MIEDALYMMAMLHALMGMHNLRNDTEQADVSSKVLIPRVVSTTWIRGGKSGKWLKSVENRQRYRTHFDLFPGSIGQIMACQGFCVAVKPTFPHRWQTIVRQQCQNMRVEIAAKFLRRFLWQ